MTTEERIATHFTEMRTEMDRLRARVMELENEVRRLNLVIENRDALEFRRRMLQSEGM